MKTDRMIEEWSERIERRLPGYRFPDNDAANTDPGLVRTARFLVALILDVLIEQRGPDFTARFLATLDPAAPLPGGATSTAAEEDLRLLSDVSATYRMCMAILGLAEAQHQYRRFVDSGLGLGRTLQSLRDAGVTAERCETAIDQLSIRLVATAHPTNIFRSIVLGARREIFALIDRLNEAVADEAEFAQIVSRLRERLVAKVATRFERWVKPDVLDEVRQVIGYFRSTIYQRAPATLVRLRAEFREIYGRELRIKEFPLLRFGSWVGGDMDGNPFVNATVYQSAIELQRRAALEMLSAELSETAPALSMAMSPRLEIEALLQSIRSDIESMRADRLDPTSLEVYIDKEPFRLKLELVRLKVDRALRRRGGDNPTRGVESFCYRLPAEVIADLRIIESALKSNGFEATARERVDPLLLRLQIFGFHLASIDLREDSLHIGRAARLALRIAGHSVDPATKSETKMAADEYRRMLSEEILNPRRIDMRRILPDSADEGDEHLVGLFESETDYQFVQRIYAMLEAARSAQRGVGPQCTSNLIITMTSSVDDILHALLLLKNAGLFLRRFDGTWQSSMDIVPLFETVEDLQSAENIMEQAVASESYRAQLGARQRRQTMMLGFSDSNKDGGYFTSNWSIYLAQTRLLALAERHGITPRFFYGRGGSIGRGGASSRHVASSLPPAAIQRGYDLTEQGEVLSRYYVTGEVASMHLETILSAAIEKNAGEERPPPAEYLSAAEELSAYSREAYRQLVHQHSGLVQYFEDCTPREVELVKIGSRPVRRRAMRTITDLRAIPWVFRWYQSRQFLPGWYGIGAGVARLIESYGIEFVRNLYAEWPFMRSILQNSALALAQSNMAIAARFRELAVDPTSAASVFALIEQEFASSKQRLNVELSCSPDRFFRADYPALYAAQRLKQPWVDSLGAIQVLLMRRYRELQAQAIEDTTALDLAREAVVSSIEGVALGLGATG